MSTENIAMVTTVSIIAIPGVNGVPYTHGMII